MPNPLSHADAGELIRLCRAGRLYEVEAWIRAGRSLTVPLPVSRGRQYGWNAKEFSDLINPLKRYLRSCIGRPWNKVHSELSQKLDRRSISGSHI